MDSILSEVKELRSDLLEEIFLIYFAYKSGNTSQGFHLISKFLRSDIEKYQLEIFEGEILPQVIKGELITMLRFIAVEMNESAHRYYFLYALSLIFPVKELDELMHIYKISPEKLFTKTRIESVREGVLYNEFHLSMLRFRSTDQTIYELVFNRMVQSGKLNEARGDSLWLLRFLSTEERQKIMPDLTLKSMKTKSCYEEYIRSDLLGVVERIKQSCSKKFTEHYLKYRGRS